MSPARSGSSEISHFQRSDGIEIRNRIMFVFYPGLPQLLTGLLFNTLLLLSLAHMHAQICQRVTREGQLVEYVNIARDTVAANWTIYSVSPLKFEVLYGGGDRTTDTPVLTRCESVLMYRDTSVKAIWSESVLLLGMPLFILALIISELSLGVRLICDADLHR